VTALRILAAGLVHLCTPGPQDGWPYRVQDELDRHEQALADLATATTAHTWWDANLSRIAAEHQLARLLNVTPPPLPAFDYDDGLTAAA
jgi:hypothetical protein